jgi:periplasmic divalent cation tolerance protein
MLTLIYCPYPSLEAAREAAMGLLEARLVACCNLLPACESIYWWEGKLAANPETVMIAKTTPDLAAAARTWIETSHPYETPAILSFSADANADFVSWVVAQEKENTPA